MYFLPQFMGIHITNATVTIHGPTLTLEGSASQLHADGAAGGPARALVFCANLVEARARVLKERKCLGEAGLSMLVEGTVKADGPLNVEKIHCAVSNTRVSFQDELYEFVQKHRRYKRPQVRQYAAEDADSAPVLPRLSPVIPKIFSLKIDTTNVTCMDNVTSTDFKVALSSLQINSRFSAAAVHVDAAGAAAARAQVYVALQLDQLELAAETKRRDLERLLYLDKLKLDAKLEKGVLNLYLILSTLNILYEHEDVFRWYTSFAERLDQSKRMQIQNVNTSQSPGLLTSVLSACVVQGCAELRNGALRARLPAPLDAGCQGLKVKLDQLLDTREEPYGSAFPRVLLGARHWSAELLLDAGWAARARAGAPPRRQHAWGAALVAVALVKWGSHGPRDSKVEAMMDCLRFEWSPGVAETIINLLDCIHAYRQPKPSQPSLPSPCQVAVNVALSHINMFLVVSEDMCLMTRVDAVTLEKSAAKGAAVVSGLKVVDMVPYKENVQCQRSDEIPESILHVRLARIEHTPNETKNSALLDFQFLETVDCEWSANLHLKILTFLRAFQGFKGELKKRSSGGGGRKSELDWRVSFKGETNLGLVLSKENNMMFATDDMTVSYEHEVGLSIVWSQLKMVLNGDELVTVEGYTMERPRDDHEVRVERSAAEGFVLPWNKVWAVTIDSVRVIFPYKHRFAEAVQGDFVSLFKWVKRVHGVGKVVGDRPLPSDLHIKIEELLIEMSDDPFEVKLRDNYELLEDEYKESQKRRTMLDAKVQELCKPHLFLPAGKVEELYSALRQKDAQIYVQRCRAAPPPRTRLVACCLTRLDILALADPAIHGAANAQARLKDIDFDSPWGEDTEFSTLWCRSVSLSCAQWQLLLRDFPQPLLRMSALRLWGALCGAEELPPPRAVRTVSVEQGGPWGPTELERSMMPLKWYYDLCCEMAEFSYAFGPCWEPVIAHCNLCEVIDTLLKEVTLFFIDPKVAFFKFLQDLFKPCKQLLFRRSLDYNVIEEALDSLKQLKKNLSTKALKEEEKEATSPKHQRELDVVSPPPASATQSTNAPGSNAEGMLAALVAEAGSEAPVVFSDELSGAEGDAPPSQQPHPRHVLDDENAHTAFLIELVNSQVVLKGCESGGYVILCAARAEVRQRVRRAPAATAWSGALSAMQYYATVSAGERDQLDENIQWVSVEEISERCGGAEISELPDVPRLVGSGHSAGGVIGRTVGPGDHAGLAQLQRIVSRCACEFYYVSHDSAEGGGGAGGWATAPQPYDSFTLMHHDLDVCTNSLQYAMLLDVVNNVVLHVEPERRRTLERRARMRFQLQLHQDQDPRQLIHRLQTQVRESLARLRRLEKEYYLKNRSISGDDPAAVAELKSLDDQVNECKETVWSLGEELDAMVRAWRETRRGAAPAVRSPSAPPHRYNEICFKCARWRLTDADGQLGIADLLLTNFLYTKTSRSDDSVEHQLEVGYLRVTNLLPNEPFPEVLVPQAPSGRAPLARRAALRVFCRDRPPVGGISVKEHFEVNIVPFRIGLTKKFFNTMLKFCFPERDPDSIEDGDEEDGTLRAGASTASLVSSGSKKVKKKGKDSNSNFYVKRDKKDKDDVEKMKERAEKNKLFIYIKIPEVPVRVSYKGSKEKNLEDVRDLPLVLPTLEYHNVTWTWLDLLLATKSDTRRVILSQAIRQKLQLHRRAAAAPEPHEEDKARLLLGERTVAENKPQKKGTPGVFKFSKS
ncbi:bridge-like lipid transfer protein family member hobbit [Choristoneura fumiferana]|uniref:bridge-like lipid transfer protein family member hobbit n=1 Tax=Choristoneura fumiferana TaxID=7141 RepID=UPI003D15BFC6